MAAPTKEFKKLSVVDKQRSFPVDPSLPPPPPVVNKLYPEIEPYQTGMLAVGDGHEIYYEQCGNPMGAPAMFLHGGPGGGCGLHTRRFFDPEYYRIVCFDQRGCNRSTPNAADDWAASIAGNDTDNLVEDCEKLRKHLNVDKWYVVVGGSWGSTLGLAYAQAHPSCISRMVLRGIFLFTPSEIDYLFQSGAAFSHHPEAWEGFSEHIRTTCENSAAWETERQNLLGAYYKRLCSSDNEVANAAARAFVRYELSISKTFPDETKLRHVLATPEILIPFALFEAHYMLNNGFIRRGQLLDNAKKMSGIPVVIVHGRCDFVCRPDAAYRLYRALEPECVRLEMVAGAGHSDSEPGIIDAIVRATKDYIRDDGATPSIMKKSPAFGILEGDEAAATAN
jgi:proline iminopeptidase